MTPTSKESERIYRVDKFIVPSQALGEFIDKVEKTHEALRTVEGFVQDFVLEQVGGSSEFNVVTVVIWESEKSIENAKQAVIARHKEMNLNPQEMYARLGIKADVATYKQSRS
jgi:heme-degrading monooxygenase HmoA